ncbi:MAG: nucleotidyl transferase AbiEii/AbiGii toxin family protein [Thaumarchaeota archaeon]|nr:nucleotidyl transferase AbiEii/AbiGii toxin family protein [Nitrososphaerota archaeon]
MAEAAVVPSKQYFDGKASETGFLTSNLEKVYRLMQILAEVNSSETEEYLALRGGTALNFCYQNVPRLSVDADLVYVKSFEKEVMEGDRERIRAILDRIFSFLKYSVELRPSYALDQYFLSYRDRTGNRDKVKVEINYVSSRVPVLKIAKRRIVNLFETGEQHQEITVLTSEEMYGSKIKALVERGIARDLFDIYNMTKTIDSIDFKTLKRAAIFYLCLELESDFRHIKEQKLSGIDESEVRRELKPLLRRGGVFPLDEAKGTVNNLITKISTLDEDEEKFVEAFYHLDYRPKLLFPENLELGHHPGAEWRLRMLARERKQ